ncbi:MAG: TonB-dependent receptor [Ferruginibacter sp.]
MKKRSRILRSLICVPLLLLGFFPLQSFAQKNSVTGKITDENGKPLADVSIVIKGTSQGVVSRNDGTFTINAANKSVLIVSAVNYVTQEVTVGNGPVNISLKAINSALDEVVVIGYGSQKKGNVSFAVSKLKNENFDERAITRVDQALVGQLAGVTVKQNTGIPGKAFSIQVRGSGSISGGNEPLYVIDGFPLTTNSSNNTNGSFSNGNPLDNINPNDIESIEVLKDAAAAAIYGSRASNGVVLITTKRGQTGKPKLSFNAYTGYNQAAKKLEMMNGQQWIDQATEVINAQYVAKYGGLGATANDDRATRLLRTGGVVDPNTILDPRWAMPGHPGLEFVDWQDVIERKGLMTNYEMSAAGGTDAVKYFISGNYANQDGVVLNTGYKIYSIRANVEINASKRFKLGLNVAPSYSITQDPGVDGKDAIFHQALSFAPVQEDTMGLYPNTAQNGQYVYSSTTNSPLGKLVYNKGITKRYRTLGTIYGEYQIAKGLNFRSSINLDNTDNNASTYVSYLTGTTQAGRTFTGSNNLLAGTSGTYNSFRRQTFVNENTLNFTKNFDRYHSNLSLLAGYSYNFDRVDRVTMSSNGGFTSAVIQTLNAAAAVTGNTTSSQSVLLSYFSRLQYGYKDKYFLLASVRRDGTSRAGKNNQFATFPAASLAWRISQEDFMKSIRLFSDLKIRVSYGANGNIPTGDYGSIATLGSFGYPYGTTPAAGIGQAPNVLANPDLKWEKSKTYDIGLDFGILKNRITGSFDYYNKLNTDLLLNVQVPEITGFQTYLNNIGSVRNIGQELEITSHNLIGKLQWNTSVTVAHNRNKIVALAPGQTQIIVPNGFTVTDQILRVGEALNSIYVLKVTGLLTAADIANHVPVYASGEAPGDFKFQDINGDGVITEADKQIVGHPNPDYTYGMTNTVRYKGFDLSVLVQGQSGASIYSQLGRAISRPGQGRSDNHPADYVNRWYSESNPGNGRFGKAYATYNNPITSATDWLYPSDYIRVRDITIGCNLKDQFKMPFLQSARVYFTLENFFGHDKYTNGLNPEAANTSAGSNGAYPEATDYGGMPLSKSLIFGLNISF